MNTNYVSAWGRTLEEYTKMFCLTDIPLNAKILSIADGPSTFNLEQRDRGVQIISVDPIYNLSVDELKQVHKESYNFNKQLFEERRSGIDASCQ